MLVCVCEVFVCRCATRVLKVYECVRETLELLQDYIFVSKVQLWTGFLFSATELEHKEHSSVVNQRTEVTYSTPN